ncbi:hypothetical protein BCR39DRAFT_557836 [Naematelia encephala]|uniref:DNA polymerase eta n=1 Tax=Naematelia encephala TaxID=71784 RepID=A0A1Y2BBQ0_9TREE|nr:hypothetical protein BCR39DRAFT_557836 [Naematelia encephala]
MSTYTYRHLLSTRAASVHNPFRTIALCDIDAAYAQFEGKRINAPRDVPLIVIQWETIIAVNYPARKYGITRCSRMKPVDALKLCPHLIVQHVATFRPGESESGYWGGEDVRYHKVSLDPYRRESEKILAVFAEFVGPDHLEKASIDEAFFDLTPLVIERLLERHPHLRSPPLDAPEGLDSALPPPPPIDWTKAGYLIPGDKEEDEDEEESTEGTWADLALSIAGEITNEMRAALWKQLQYTCSAGVAHNKALAKLCASVRKPNGQSVLRLSATPAFLSNVEFQDIRYLGGKLGAGVADKYGVTSVSDLLGISLQDFQHDFGPESIWVYNIIRGIDHTPITPRSVLSSMLASKNTIPPVTTHSDGVRYIHLLSGELHLRLQEFRARSPGIWPKTLVLHHRTGNQRSRARQMPFRYTPKLSTEYIDQLALKLWDGVHGEIQAGGIRLANISLQFTDLERVEMGQKRISDFCSNLESAKVEPEFERKRFRTTSPIEHIEPIKLKQETIVEPTAESISSTDLGPDDISWTCPRCRHVVETSDEKDANERFMFIINGRREHEDYHFAYDLQQGPEEHEPARKKSRTANGEGIKAFFHPKRSGSGASARDS